MQRDIAVAGLVFAALAGAVLAQTPRTLTDRDYITGTAQGVAILAAEDSRAATPEQLVETLERLALDQHDNVRETTLAQLKTLRGQEAEAAFAAALGRSGYQLLRTAARELAGLRPTQALTSGLLEALHRVTAQRRETSRDTRLALLERLREFGNEALLERLRPLLRDFDSRVASAAAAVMSTWSAQSYPIDPQPLPLESLPLPSELKLIGENVAVLLMESGREIAIQLDPVAAPVTLVRFLRLANKNYFDGLTFHRIVSNFIVQGGSPGANEYMGDPISATRSTPSATTVEPSVCPPADGTLGMPSSSSTSSTIRGWISTTPYSDGFTRVTGTGPDRRDPRGGSDQGRLVRTGDIGALTGRV